MSIHTLVRSALVACLLAIPAATWAGTASTTVTITETVDTFAEWDSGTGIATLDVADHITDLAAHTGSLALHLYTNANTVDGTVTVAAAPVADTNGNATGILKNAAGSVALTTSYSLTGAGLQSPDAAFKAADSAGGDFFDAANTYTLKNGAVANNDYAITLNVQAQAATNSAPPAEVYTAAITLTASW
jgi:hypothetical protein